MVHGEGFSDQGQSDLKVDDMVQGMNRQNGISKMKSIKMKQDPSRWFHGFSICPSGSLGEGNRC